MKTEYPVISESVEPAFSHIIGRLWKQLEESKGTHRLEDQCYALWAAVTYMNRLACVCSTADNRPAHLNIACSNMFRLASKAIEDAIGFNPLHDRDHDIVKQWNASLGRRS